MSYYENNGYTGPYDISVQNMRLEVGLETFGTRFFSFEF